MCTLESLLPTVLVLSLFKIGAGLYVLVAGALLVESLPIQMAYSVNFVDIGGSLVALGLFSMLTSFPLVYAVKKHNRFLLVVVFCLDTIFMGQLVNLGDRNRRGVDTTATQERNTGDSGILDSLLVVFTHD